MLESLLALFLLAAEAPPPPPEVVVLATVHAPTPRYPEARLAETLSRAKPDLVLLELDPSFSDAEGNLKKEFESVSLETKVAVACAKGTGARLRPYDIEGRNAFFQENDCFTKERKLDEIRRLHEAGQLSPEADQLYQGLLALSAEAWKMASVRTARGINAPTLTRARDGSGLRPPSYRRCFSKKASVRSQASLAAAASYRGVVSLLNPCCVPG